MLTNQFTFPPDVHEWTLRVKTVPAQGDEKTERGTRDHERTDTTNSTITFHKPLFQPFPPSFLGIARSEDITRPRISAETRARCFALHIVLTFYSQMDAKPRAVTIMKLSRVLVTKSGCS